MDSTDNWEVAERLGVRNTCKDKTALVIADLETDAQFVLDEGLQITNSSIAEFVLAFMAGNLTRRFTSRNARSQECLSSQACIIEVVTSNFHDIVLDESKDVLLLYYTPWCGYCQALWPVLLTVAKFFQSISDVTIARINADENDLPWEFYVPQYPSFILFPAYRKDFSIRFPDEMERTAANIAQFVLDYGVKAGKVFEEFCLSEMVGDQLKDLETFLCQVEEAMGIIEEKRRDALRSRGAATLKSSQPADLTKKQELRISSEHLTINYHQVKKDVLKLIEWNTDVLKQLTASEANLNQKEELLSQLKLNSKRVDSEQLIMELRNTEIALQGEKKVLLELKKSLIAVRRRATQLDMSISFFGT